MWHAWNSDRDLARPQKSLLLLISWDSESRKPEAWILSPSLLPKHQPGWKRKSEILGVKTHRYVSQLHSPLVERKWKSLGHVRLFVTIPHGLHRSWNSPGQNTGVGSLSILQGIFPLQGLKPGLPHCRRILYQLSHKGSPRILEWVAYPRGSSWPRNRTRVSCLAQADSLPTGLSQKPFLT